MTFGGTCSPATDEQKEKARIGSMGNKNASGKRSGEALENIRYSFKNRKPVTEQAKKNISIGQKNSEKFKKTMQSPEYKEKMRVASTGRKQSEHTKAKLRKAWEKRKLRMTDIDREKLAKVMRENNRKRVYKKGYKLTEEHKEKLRKAKKNSNIHNEKESV